MTTDQLKEGKRLSRQINQEKSLLQSMELDVALGGRRGGYEFNAELDPEMKDRDLFNIDRQKKRIAFLEAQFANL